MSRPPPTPLSRRAGAAQAGKPGGRGGRRRAPRARLELAKRKSTGLGLAPLPVPGAESKRDGLRLAGAVLAGSGGTADRATRPVRRPERRRHPGSVRAGALPRRRGPGAPARWRGPRRAAGAGGCGEWQATGGGGEPGPGSSEECGLGAWIGAVRTPLPAGPCVPAGDAAGTGRRPCVRRSRAAAEDPSPGGRVRRHRRTPRSSAGNRQAAPQPTASGSCHDGAEASAPAADSGASPADSSGDPSGLAALSAPALDPSVADARLLRDNNGADSKQASPAAADDAGQQQPAAELAFAARLSPGESERVRRAGGPDSAGLDAGNGQPRGTTGGSAQDVVSPAWGSAAPEEAGAQSDAAPASMRRASPPRPSPRMLRPPASPPVRWRMTSSWN